MKTQLSVLFLGAMLGGCVQLKPRLIQTSIEKPSHIALYLSVDNTRGEPVPGLGVEHFQIAEDNKPLAPLQSRQTLLDPVRVAAHATVLLIDMSGQVARSQTLPILEQAVNNFVGRVGQSHPVAVYAFDGSADIVPIREFDAPPGPVVLSMFTTRDPSTNLYGAVLKASEVLQQKLALASLPLRHGTLVVFTDGRDLAHRVSVKEFSRAWRKVDVDRVLIGVGPNIDERELRMIAKTGLFKARETAALGNLFDQVAQRVDGYVKRFYLLSYCSPARAGKRSLTVQVVAPNRKKGKVSLRFNADGFGPDCDPSHEPSFAAPATHK